MDGDALGLPGTEDSLTGKEHTPSAMCDAPTPLPESPEDEQTRFRVELEFVQCLANPLYLHCLSPSTIYTHTLSLWLSLTVVCDAALAHPRSPCAQRLL